VTPRMRPSRAAASRNARAFLLLVGFVCGPAALGATTNSSSEGTASSTRQTETSSTSSPAAAEPGTPDAAAVQPAPAQAPGSAPAEPTARREVPDYRQLEPEPTTAGDVLIWVPRVILLPAHLVTEYTLRVPVGAAATEAERSNWPGAVYDFFAFAPDHKGGILPTFSFNTGFRPSIGFHFWWDDTFVAGNTISADAAWGGSNWIHTAIGDRYRFSPADDIAFQVEWQRRPDQVYFGIGSGTPDTYRSRYATDQVEGRVVYTHATPRGLRVEVQPRIYRTVFRDWSCCGDPSLADRVAAGQLAAPPGFQENYTAAALELALGIDTRNPGPTNRSGVRIGAMAAPAVDVTRGFDRSWIRYGGLVEGSWDVTRKGRVLSLGLFTMFADPLGSQPVPFTELVSVGGTEPFAGFLNGRLRGRSAIAAQLSWRWPVFAYLDGVAAVGFGNVFDAHLTNFRWDLLRLSAELGVRTAAAFGKSNFQMVFGMGSEPFRDGLRLTSFRFALGVTYGI
jgi:hypothetical protein